MRRIGSFLAFFALMSFLVACGDKKAPTGTTQKDKKEYVFTKEDTTEVYNLVNRFISRLENNDLRSAVEMLMILKGDSVLVPDGVQMRRQAIALSMIKGVKYDINHIDFNSDKNNEVKIDITLFDKEEGDTKPNKTSFYFRPVRFEGKWYLTTKDNITDINNGNKVEEE